ncbi:VIT1/CCC1 transporter family protein [Psychrobacter lutiphocae]|uniref:VIT1/CCC1 transporter family protein n=1 Tax=Psychrobacter lutiphocae TaxID=540500 RepID=UPI00036D1641|nr:VIT family protein [Psychrobacter lutiphocae]
MQFSIHSEPHLSGRNNWLRASVLGANDGLISTSSILAGIAATNSDIQTLLLTGVAALVAGALSMAAGEYISVSSQADTERADLALEKKELTEHPNCELEELTNIYLYRGLDHDLAHKVAVALTEHNAIEAHARDEIGLTETMQPKPLQAAVSSAIAFSLGAMLPILGIVLAPAQLIIPALVIVTLFGLVILGVSAAKLGGAPVLPATLRVVIWGSLAMLATSLIGKLFGVSI